LSHEPGPAGNRFLGSLKGLQILALLFRIDLLCLDIEGVEDAVLQTLPWDKVDIETLLVEVYSTIYKS
jgi:hypothetical protein